jgi:hypothetical protein
VISSHRPAADGLASRSTDYEVEYELPVGLSPQADIS